MQRYVGKSLFTLGEIIIIYCYDVPYCPARLYRLTFSLIFTKTDAICKGLVSDKFVYKFILPFKTNETLEKDERETVQR